MSYKKQELPTIHEDLGSSLFLEVLDAHLFTFLCFTFCFVCLSSVYCAKCYIALAVSLNCLFLIAPLVFSLRCKISDNK